MIVTVTPNPALDRTLTVPRITFNEVIRATASRLDWGGKGFNVSRALAALGVESIAMGFIGGATGRWLEHGLRDLGIATDFVYIAGETRTNTVIVEANTGQYIKVNEAGPTIQAEEVAAFFDRARERVHAGDIWVVAGALPSGAPTDFYTRLIALVQGGEARALLDSSGEPLRLGCAARPYLVKPNVAEAQEVTGRGIRSDADVMAAAGSFLRQGIELVALSRGDAGLLLASREQAVWARPPRVQVQHPTGAGDALVAGLAWALQQELPLEEMARWGVAAGAAAAAHEGVSFGSRAEVEALSREVQIG